MRILFTVNGRQDPINNRNTDGPILSLLELKNDFDEVHLFYTSDFEEKARGTKTIIETRHPRIRVVQCPLNLEDSTGKPNPTNYSMILGELRKYLDKMDFTAHSYAVYATPGTSVMHTCWVLLVASREIVASLIQKSDPEHLKPGEPPITEIVPDDPAFPEIRQRQRMPDNVREEIKKEQLEKACKEVGIIGNHPLFMEALETAANAARSDAPVLISGESGTGKELLAKLIHLLSGVEGVFEALNCGAVPENLFETELFGHEPSAFSGAGKKTKQGKIEVAHNGTLFLDEIGEMSLSHQVKLLRVIQEKQLTRVGGTRPVNVNFRLITATNRDLWTMVNQNQFRIDLFYRISVIPIELPPLRKRRSDIPLLVQSFLDEFNRRDSRPVIFPPEVLSRFSVYDWPGNIRELRNIVQRTHVLTVGDRIPETLIQTGGLNFLSLLPDPGGEFKWTDFIKRVREHMFHRALELSCGNQTKAAQLLGVTNSAVHTFLKEKTDNKGKEEPTRKTRDK